MAFWKQMEALIKNISGINPRMVDPSFTNVKSIEDETKNSNPKQESKEKDIQQPKDEKDSTKKSNDSQNDK